MYCRSLESNLAPTSLAPSTGAKSAKESSGRSQITFETVLHVRIPYAKCVRLPLAALLLVDRAWEHEALNKFVGPYTVEVGVEPRKVTPLRVPAKEI